MSEGKISLPVVRTWGETARRDLWWVQPVVVFTVFTSFVVYATWAAFQNDHYSYGPYLSPFYSPVLMADSPEQLRAANADAQRIERAENQSSHMVFGKRGRPGWWPGWLPFSPALFILGIPVGFRMTCYYYRGAYYKAFWSDPPDCAVGEWRQSYWGENTWPLLIQNAHRYFLYLAIVFIGLLSYDAIVSFYDNGRLGIGVGSIVLTVNAILLGGYTFGCHSLRHLVGGRCDELANAPNQKKAYDCVSCLNRWHMAWAWCSLFWVGFSDVYVRMCSMGIWTDYRLVI